MTTAATTREALRLAADAIATNLEHGQTDAVGTTHLDHLADSLATSLGHADWPSALEQIDNLRTYLNGLETLCVVGARHTGHAWQEIADWLGVKMQSAWERFHDLADRGVEQHDQTIAEIRDSAERKRRINEELLGMALTDEQEQRLRSHLDALEREAATMIHLVQRARNAAEALDKPPPKRGRPSLADRPRPKDRGTRAPREGRPRAGS